MRALSTDAYVKKKVVDNCIKYIQGDDYSMDIMKWAYAEENSKSIDDISDDEWEDVQDEFLREEIWFRYDIFEQKLENLIENGYISIWRAITVDEDWFNRFLKSGKHLGIYWSWDPRAAEPHWGYNSGKTIEVVFQSKVRLEHIDKEATMMANLIPSSEEEREVTLIKGTLLKLDNLTIDGNDVDISNVKSFKA